MCVRYTVLTQRARPAGDLCVFCGLQALPPAPPAPQTTSSISHAIQLYMVSFSLPEVTRGHRGSNCTRA
eukprot:4495841-Prymnesium_polylepis.1